MHRAQHQLRPSSLQAQMKNSGKKNKTKHVTHFLSSCTKSMSEIKHPPGNKTPQAGLIRILPPAFHRGRLSVNTGIHLDRDVWRGKNKRCFTWISCNGLAWRHDHYILALNSFICAWACIYTVKHLLYYSLGSLSARRVFLNVDFKQLEADWLTIQIKTWNYFVASRNWRDVIKLGFRIKCNEKASDLN